MEILASVPASRGCRRIRRSRQDHRPEAARTSLNDLARSTAIEDHVPGVRALREISDAAVGVHVVLRHIDLQVDKSGVALIRLHWSRPASDLDSGMVLVLELLVFAKSRIH